MSNERENEIPRISWVVWLVMLAISVFAGGSLHWVITTWIYHRASTTAASEAAYFSRNWRGVETGGDARERPEALVPAADLTLRYLGLPADSIDSALLSDLRNAYAPYSTNSNQDSLAGIPKTREITPALVVAARLLRPGQSSECDDKIVKSVAAALGRQLLGWPGDTNAELSSIQQFRKARADNGDSGVRSDGALMATAAPSPTPAPKSDAPAVAAAKSPDSVRANIMQACKQFANSTAPSIKLLGPTFSRTDARSADDLAELIFGASSCLPGGPSNRDFTECRLVKAHFAGALNSDAVRNSRLNINFIWGWERAAVAVLATLVLLAMWYLRRERKPLEEQEKWLGDWLAAAEKRLSPNKPNAAAEKRLSPNEPNAPISNPEVEANLMLLQFHEKFGKSGSQTPPFKWNGGLTVLRDLVDAAQESLKTEHRAHLEKFVELHTQALARQRAFINALITAFPAIGLVATLHGLIFALSRASGIVAGSEAERVASTELVTGVLSSSFATTMLALIFMAIYMLLNVREEHREADLLEGTLKRLLAVFWPGRPASTPMQSSDRKA